MWWRELDEVENECTLHNFSPFIVFLPKIIKIGGNLTKFWQKQFCTVFWDTVYSSVRIETSLIISLNHHISHNIMLSPKRDTELTSRLLHCNIFAVIRTKTKKYKLFFLWLTISNFILCFTCICCLVFSRTLSYLRMTSVSVLWFQSSCFTMYNPQLTGSQSYNKELTVT